MFHRNLSQQAVPTEEKKSPESQPAPMDFDRLLQALEAFVDEQAHAIQEIVNCEEAA